jgi:hypothetical protein
MDWKGRKEWKELLLFMTPLGDLSTHQLLLGG